MFLIFILIINSKYVVMILFFQVKENVDVCVVNLLISFVYLVFFNIFMMVYDFGFKKSWVFVLEFGSFVVEGGSVVFVSNFKYFFVRYWQNIWFYLFGLFKRDCKFSNIV